LPGNCDETSSDSTVNRREGHDGAAGLSIRGVVSRSGFYAARQRTRQAPVVCGTRVRLRSVFEATGRSYGSRRLRQELAAEGIELGRYRVRRLMKELQLKPIWKPKFVHTTDSNHHLPVYENVLDRQFEQAEANRAWVSDISVPQQAA